MKTLKVKFKKRTYDIDVYCVNEDDLAKQAKEKLNFDCKAYKSNGFIKEKHRWIEEINILRTDWYRNTHKAIEVKIIPILD